MAPAIALADVGFELSAAEAGRIASAAERLREFDASRAIFLKPDGGTWAGGERFRQPLLAATLRAIARGGADAFYRGDIARRIAADVAAHGGFVTEADLAAYKADASIVVRGLYRDYELIGSYLPASGATSIEILQVLDHIALPAPGSAAWVSVVAQALLIGFADRTASREPPADKAAWLTSTDLAIERAASIRLPSAVPDSLRLDTMRAVADTAMAEPEHTTHVSVADAAGNVVALTHRSAHARLEGRDTGARLRARGHHALPRQTRARNTPALVLAVAADRAEGRPAPLRARRRGRPAHRSGLVETLSRAIDEGLPLEQAQAAPRFHPSLADRHGIARRRGLAGVGTATARRDSGTPSTCATTRPTSRGSMPSSSTRQPASGSASRTRAGRERAGAEHATGRAARRLRDLAAQGRRAQIRRGRHSPGRALPAQAGAERVARAVDFALPAGLHPAAPRPDFSIGRCSSARWWSSTRQVRDRPVHQLGGRDPQAARSRGRAARCSPCPRPTSRACAR